MTEPEFTTEELENEEWRDVIGHEGWYSVSNLGRVKRERPGKGTYAGRMLGQNADTYGYPSVSLTRNSVLYRVNVHLLVSRAFIGPKPDGYEVNHMDGNKWNTRASNLEYRTHQENMDHASAIGLFKHPARGNKNGSRLYPERLRRGETHHAFLKPETYNNHGEKCERRLTPDEVHEIRRLGDNRLLLRKEIIKRFRISLTTLKHILARRTHADLEELGT